MDQTPSTPIPAQPTPTPKRHRGRNAIIVLLIVIVALLIGIATTGVYTIPGLSRLLGADKPQDLGVQASQEALDTFFAGLPTRIETEASRRCLTCNRIYEGSVPIEARPTDQEITSFLKLQPRQQGDLLKHTQVKYIEGGMEISTKVSRYIKAPVYAKVLVSKGGPKSVSLTLVEGKVGRMAVPEKYLQQAEDYFEDLANDHLAGIEGFSIETLEYHPGTSYFKGTLPAVVKSAPGTWAGPF